MAKYAYERLSGQDNDFLRWETPNLPMHVGSTQVFDAGPLRTDDGGIDFDSIKRLTQSILHRMPRYRQKLAWIPRENHAVWVDDENFSLDYHFRHTSLPRPGSDEQLKRLQARIMEHSLDRARPLWETWVVEGLANDRLALISKMHHCMVDGASGMDLTNILLSRTPERRIRRSPRYIPRPVPSPRELWRDELRRRLAMPVGAIRGLSRFLQRENAIDEIGVRLRALGDMVHWKAQVASETPLNGEVGPHRIVDWTSMSLADIKALRKKLGCSVNDVVLAIVTGAVRRFMLRRTVRPEKLDFRVSIPVNIRHENQLEMGNKVSSWVVRLPLGEEDPLRQVEAIVEATQALKDSRSSVAIEMVNALNEWLPIDIQAASVGTMNMIVTNVPGPQVPLYMLGAEVLEMFPHPPLLENLALSIGVVSYNGRMCWGFNADYDRVPDLEEFVHGMKRSFEHLALAAGVTPGESRVLELHSESAGAQEGGPKRKAAQTNRKRKGSAARSAPVEAPSD